jgi:hypothetical protein
MRSDERSRLRRCALITGSMLLTLVLGVLAGCVGLPANVANCRVTPTPPSHTSIVPPAAEPPQAALCGFPLTISSPGKWRQCSLAGTHCRTRDAAGPDLYRSPLRRWLRSALLASDQHQPIDLDAQRTTHR